MEGIEVLSTIQRFMESMGTHGARITLTRVARKLRNLRAAEELSRRRLFSDAELAEQRSHIFAQSVLVSVVVPVHNTPRRYLRAMLESVRAQTYGNWELCLADASDARHAHVRAICEEYADRDVRIRYTSLQQNLGISGNTNAALAMATGDYVGLLDHDDVLHPAALYEVVRAICHAGADMVYTDETTFRRTPRDAFRPHLKPAFEPDTLLGNNYICHFLVFRRSLLDEVGPFDPACDGAQDHDMVLRLSQAARRVAHVPEILYYWRAHPGSVARSGRAKTFAADAGVRVVRKHLERLGVAGSVRPIADGATVYRVSFGLAAEPLVSVLIPNCEHVAELSACVESVLGKTTYRNYEVVIVENNSTSDDVFAYYDRLQREHDNVRVVRWEGPFDYAAINNYGAGLCAGEYLLLLNNDTQVLSADWMQEMLMHAQRDCVGAVGAKLLYPNGTIQHAGICVGIGDVAANLGRGLGSRSPGHMFRLLYAHDVSAVTAACMMVRRSVWEQMGGFDPTFAVEYNDVDLCLRMGKAGYLVVWTPFAELYHCESRSRAKGQELVRGQRHRDEVRAFRERWHEELQRGDLHYNPSFSLQSERYLIDPHPRRHDARWTQ